MVDNNSKYGTLKLLNEVTPLESLLNKKLISNRFSFTLHKTNFKSKKCLYCKTNLEDARANPVIEEYFEHSYVNESFDVTEQ